MSSNASRPHFPSVLVIKRMYEARLLRGSVLTRCSLASEVKQTVVGRNSWKFSSVFFGRRQPFCIVCCINPPCGHTHYSEVWVETSCNKQVVRVVRCRGPGSWSAFLKYLRNKSKSLKRELILSQPRTASAVTL